MTVLIAVQNSRTERLGCAPTRALAATLVSLRKKFFLR
jgi:hypothetical protein